MKSNTVAMLTAFYFGFALSMFGNVNFMQWQFYAICVPVIAGYSIARTMAKDEY